MVRYLITIALFAHGIGHLLFLTNSPGGSGREAMKATRGYSQGYSAQGKQSRGSSGCSGSSRL